MKYLFILISIALLGVSCNNASNSTEESTNAGTSKTEGDLPGENGAVLSLNDGQKWKVNEEMMIYVQKMEADIAELESAEQKDHAALAVKLDQNIEQIISSCTMTGEAHDELHKWLIPFIDLVDEYAGSIGADDYEKHFADIKTSMAEFREYFD